LKISHARKTGGQHHVMGSDVQGEVHNAFLKGHTELAHHNQYWYSARTIQKLVQELQDCGASSIAFLSTPSIYFSLPKGSELRGKSWLFDFDDQWAEEPNFAKYDYKAPEELPQRLLGTFDAVVIDPPFITEEVWEKYAEAAKLLLQPEGSKVVCSTVAENMGFMDRLLAVKPVPFKPSIPNLVYQYTLFTNFEPTVLCELNPEVPEE